MPEPASRPSDPLWYKDAIIYEMHVRGFYDANEDGVGDFRGLIEKLDYLQQLGVTCLWLLPFYPSPLRDDGYDIANYTSVHPSYGTLEDFREFLEAAHARDLRVLIELVINHTSDQHPWFQAARRAPAGSPERDYYVWSDTDQKYTGTRIIFTDTEKSNWAWDPEARAYYWHRFFSHQPDLNFDNPAVVSEVLNVMRFWLDMGVDALRLDAVPYLIEREGTNCENLPESHAIIKTIRSTLDREYHARMLLAEANSLPQEVRAYFGAGDECHMAFHFPLMPRLFMALRLEDRTPILEVMAETPTIPDPCQWAIFLRNHDELTLEMVTDEERDYMYLAYGTDPRMRINVGIRRRLAPLLENNRSRIELLNSLLFSLPGTPIIYSGDEIGMGDNIYLGDRHSVRTPMQWSGDRNGGFSRADPARLYSPVIMDPIYGYQAVNVEAEGGDPSSLLNWTRNMIALRRLFQGFGRGATNFLEPANRKILAYIRYHEGEQLLCVANLSRFAQPFELDLSALEGLTPVEMRGYVEFPQIGAAPYPLTLGPYGFLWFELHAEQDAKAAVDDRPGERGTTIQPSHRVSGSYHEDGWTFMQEELARFYERAFTKPLPPTAAGPALVKLDIGEQPLTPMMDELLGISDDAAATLGKRVAQLHLARAMPSDDPALRPEPVTAADLLALSTEIRGAAVQALEGLEAALARLPRDVAGLASETLSYRGRVGAILEPLSTAVPNFTKIAIHGDLQLGRVRRAGQDFIIDQGGGGGAPRSKRVALIDVAAMLRSIRHAAQVGLETHVARHAGDLDRMEPWAGLWERSASAMFIRAYRETAAGASFLPSDSGELRQILEALLLDHAVGELNDHLDDRAPRLRILLIDIMRILAP
ncbi:MAG: maltose alpha-D-glucosyltransferase [Gemmatimonadota bacterium]